MNEISNLGKFLFQIFGCVLIVIGMYVTIKSYPFYDFRKYTYITKKERNKRSLKAGLGSIGFIFGFLFLIFPTIVQGMTTINLLLQITGFGLCVSLIVLPLAFLRMYRDLRTYTKMEDDIVATNKDKNIKG